MIELKNANELAAMIGENTDVVLDFYAPWCQPCKQVARILTEDLEASNLIKINIDEFPDLGAEYKVRGLPTLIRMTNGEIQETLVGSQSKATLKEFIE